MVSISPIALKLSPSKDTPTRQAYRRVLRMMEDPDGGGGDNIFDEELDEDGNAIRKGTPTPHLKRGAKIIEPLFWN